MGNRSFERLCQPGILQEAWTAVKSKNSAGGIDGVTVKDFDEKADKYLSEILTELKSGRWTPYPYLGISIPKKNNERRQLGTALSFNFASSAPSALSQPGRVPSE